MFWKGAKIVQMWDWEVLTRFRKPTQNQPYLSQEDIAANLKKKWL